jgi:hypothetical protein
MTWGQHGKISYTEQYGLTEHPIKTPLGMSPYQLVYRKTCHLPIDLEFKAHWAIKGGIWTFKQLGRRDRCNSLS